MWLLVRSMASYSSGCGETQLQGEQRVGWTEQRMTAAQQVFGQQGGECLWDCVIPHMSLPVTDPMMQ